MYLHLEFTKKVKTKPITLNQTETLLSAEGRINAIMMQVQPYNVQHNLAVGEVHRDYPNTSLCRCIIKD
jgi:hypothetical protein